jgi:hypothetical protein
MYALVGELVTDLLGLGGNSGKQHKLGNVKPPLGYFVMLCMLLEHFGSLQLRDVQAISISSKDLQKHRDK